ncbi:HRDC domain-containing protein [Plantibacter sp. Mn2098]|uniref:HRDC domain-containing protein n=1 Tax=Plantibacter sp. Mn2098 TaxID=3395266 RepID=UPI003BD9ABF6
MTEPATDAVPTVRSVTDTREAYLASLETLAAGTGPFALDAERASGYRYSQRAYLIQVYRRGAGVFLYDPPAIGSMAELGALIQGEVSILHAASQDLACLREVGIDPSELFDTELGARLLGLDRVGLGAVVEEVLGIHLAKEHSAADWSTRPLPESWLEYAALDVELLVDVYDDMVRRLAEADKTEIARQEFQATLARETKAPRAEPWRRLSGVHAIRGLRNLAVARELWLARDALARERDTAPGRLIPDASLTAAAKVNPPTKRDLLAIKDFRGRTSRSDSDVWWNAIATGQSTEDLPVSRPASDTLPPPRSWSDKNPEAHERYTEARARITERAEALHMPVENLLTPETLRRLSWNPPAELTADAVAAALRNHDARPWQIDATAQTIADAFVESNQRAADEVEEPS